jgi:hypothetical protein
MLDVSCDEKKFEGRPFILFSFLRVIYEFFEDFSKCVSVLEEIFRITAATSSCNVTSAFFKSEKINFSLSQCLCVKA